VNCEGFSWKFREGLSIEALLSREKRRSVRNLKHSEGPGGSEQEIVEGFESNFDGKKPPLHKVFRRRRNTGISRPSQLFVQHPSGASSRGIFEFREGQGQFFWCHVSRLERKEGRKPTITEHKGGSMASKQIRKEARTSDECSPQVKKPKLWISKDQEVRISLLSELSTSKGK